MMAFLTLCCCQKQKDYDGQALPTVHFVYGSSDVKTLSVNENYISDCNIMVYDFNGRLVASQYCSSGPVASLSFSCAPGSAHKFYCVCNIGNITDNPAFVTESGLAGYCYSVTAYNGIINEFGAVAMSGCTTVMSVTDGMNIVIDLTRCVALVTVRIDDSGLEHSEIDITSVQLKNSPGKVSLFGSSAISSASERTLGNDSADSSELITFNSGDPIGFYMFENDQGELLPQNDNCSGKVFSHGSIYESICSYIELTGNYDDRKSDNPRHGSFTYRFYLGGNPTTDFSVLRNRHYSIVLKVSDGGIDEESWRVDSDLKPYATAVIVDPREYIFPSPGETYTLSATVLPLTVSQEVIWSTDNASVATVDQNGCVRAIAPGQTFVKATATDGSGVFDTCRISVEETGLPISIRPNYLAQEGWVLGCGSSVDDFAVIITYDNGREKILHGSEALATIDNTDDEWIIYGNTLIAPSNNSALELLLRWQDPGSGRILGFSSEGEVIPSKDIFTLTYEKRVPKKYGVLNDRPVVVSDIRCYTSPITDLSTRLKFSSGSTLIEPVSEGFALKGDTSLNGDLNYSITGSFIDDFNNLVSKTINCKTTIFEWRKHYYNVNINTKVRNHIDASYGSQEPADNIIVTITLVKSWTDPEQVASYFFPASYDENGDLVQGYFSYTWYEKTLTVQMQDDKDYWFDYDDDGNRLVSGYWYENGEYNYYEPLNN